MLHINKAQLDSKLSIIDSLTFEELMSEFLPHNLIDQLRWLHDISYQKVIAEKIFEKVKHDAAIPVELFQKLATALMQGGEFSLAMELYQIALNCLEHDTTLYTVARLTVEVNCEIGLAVCPLEQHREKKKDEVAQHIENAVATAELLEAEDRVAGRMHLANIKREYGLAYVIAGDFDTATEYFRQGVAYCEGIEELAFFQIPLKNYVALSLFRAGKISEGLAEFERVNELYRTLPNAAQVCDPDYACQDYGSHISHYGMACVATKEYERAITLFQQALVFRQNLTGQQQDRVVDTHEWLGKAYLGNGMQEKAVEHFLRAKEICQSLPNPIQKRLDEIESLLKPLQKSPAVVSVRTVAALFQGSSSSGAGVTPQKNI